MPKAISKPVQKTTKKPVIKPALKTTSNKKEDVVFAVKEKDTPTKVLKADELM
jgi:hypothetical protein